MLFYSSFQVLDEQINLPVTVAIYDWGHTEKRRMEMAVGFRFLDSRPLSEPGSLSKGYAKSMQN